MRYLRYTVLLLAIVLWGAGLSGTVSHWLYEIGIVTDDYRYGDLYRMAPLPQFKQPQPECAASNQSSDTASTQLYILGDSFTEPYRLSKSDFRVSYFQRVAWAFQQRVQLNPSKRNVLLIESVERHVRDHFPLPVTEFVVEADTNQTPSQRPTLWERIKDEFHRKDAEERLGTVLFSQDWAFWFKELKAKLTLNWFGRVSTGVSLSKNQRHIFIESDTDTTRAKRLNSSFSSLSDHEVNVLVDSINATADRYRKAGFDAVYLSIIPNKATILEPNRGMYNHLIERIQKNPRLHVPTVNVYDAYRQKPLDMYLKNDTHWTCEGRVVWVNLVREKIGI